MLWRAGKPPEETAAVTYGWQPGADGALLYYVQVDPTLLRTLATGDEIHAIIRPDAGRVATFVAVAGTKQLPKVTAGNQPGATTLAMTTPPGTSKTPPTTTPPLTTPPLSTPPLTTPPASTRPGLGSNFDSGRTRFNPSSEIAPISGTTPNPASEQPLYRSGATTTPPATTNPGVADTAAGPRPRWSVTSDLPSDTNPANASTFDSSRDPARTGRSGLLDPPAYGSDPTANPNGQYTSPLPDYRNENRTAGINDPNRRFDTTAPTGQYDPTRSASGGNYQDGGYRPSANPNYQDPAGPTGYANQGGNVPFRERQTGFDNQQYQQPAPDDRFASRAPNVPVGAMRPMMQTDPMQQGYPSTQAMLPQTVVMQPAPQVAPAPAAELKPQTAAPFRLGVSLVPRLLLRRRQLLSRLDRRGVLQPLQACQRAASHRE